MSVTREQINLALEANNTNLCAWARGHGYHYMSVYSTVSRWGGRTDRTPHGGIARTIMRELAEYVDKANEEISTNSI